MTFTGKILKVVYNNDSFVKCLVENVDTQEVLCVDFKTHMFPVVEQEQYELNVSFKVIEKVKEHCTYYNQIITCNEMI